MFRRPVICSNVGGPAERVDDDVFGLHFQIGDPQALAFVIRRACTEKNLWDRLVSAMPKVPSRGEMLSGYRDVYKIPARV